jgi:hypothetical protein
MSDTASDFTISQWCAKHRICRATYYNLQRVGKAPNIIYIGSRPRITPEANKAWEREREAEAQAQLKVQKSSSAADTAPDQA